MSKTSSPKYYVFYEKRSGKILGAGNEKDSRFEYGIEVPFDEVENLLNGNWHFRDYLVGYKREIDGSSRLSVVPNTEQGYTFKNNIFEWITETKKKVECLVTWNGKDACWEFSLDKKVKENYADRLLIPKLVFFVTLESDFDFLIRTIFIESLDLISSEKITIPFERSIEYKIDKISISSKLVFKNYGLRIINE
jgi:hypothetical protein